MTAAITFALGYLLGLLIMRYLGRRRVRPDVSGEEDEVLLANLETHAVTSPLAARLLAVAREDPAPAWQNTTTVSLPPQEHWRLVLKEWEQAASVEERLSILRYQRARGMRFTWWERAHLLADLPDEPARQEARRLFFQSPDDTAKQIQQNEQ